MNSNLDRLSKANFISSIDLKDGFWQMVLILSESSRPKTAFAVPDKRLYQMKVVGFGFKNIAQQMQRLMDYLFGERFFPYIDDVIVVNETFDKHIEDLKYLFHQLKAANHTINWEKSKFCRPPLKYLGFIVDSQGLHTHTCPDKERHLKFRTTKKYNRSAPFYWPGLMVSAIHS